MTVGISFTNGREAVVVTDSRILGWGRQSDSINKMGEFATEQYHGVLFGAGQANAVEAAIENLEQCKGKSLEEFVNKVFGNYRAYEDNFESIYLATEKKEIEKKSMMFEDLQKRTQFVEQETSNLLGRYTQYHSDPNTQSQLMIVAFDKDHGIRQMNVRSNNHMEIFLPHMTIGSGADGANMYFAKKLQGVDSKTLDSKDLGFFAVNAYAFSTVNEGVGGTPKIAYVKSDAVNGVEPIQSIVLANLCGAYLAGIPGLDTETAREIFRNTLSNQNPDYDSIARTLDVNKRTLCEMLIPYSLWQERENRRTFKTS